MYALYQNRSWSLTEIPDEIELRSLSGPRTLTNLDMEEPDFSFQLDSTWPDSIPNHEVPPMNFTIETGIAVPKRYQHTGRTRAVAEAMGQLELNQSFFMPSDDMTTNQINSLVGTARREFPGKRFVTRKTVTPPAGVRIWRVE